MLFNTLMMAIVYKYKRIITSIARQQGRLLLCHKLLSYLIYITYAPKIGFSYFPLTRLI
jgi:hypothetical protein